MQQFLIICLVGSAIFGLFSLFIGKFDGTLFILLGMGMMLATYYISSRKSPRLSWHIILGFLAFQGLISPFLFKPAYSIASIYILYLLLVFFLFQERQIRRAYILGLGLCLVGCVVGTYFPPKPNFDLTVFLCSLMVQTMVFGASAFLWNLFFTQNESLQESIKMREASLKQAQTLSQIGSWEWDFQTHTFKTSEQFDKLFNLPPNHTVNVRAWSKENILEEQQAQFTTFVKNPEAKELDMLVPMDRQEGKKWYRFKFLALRDKRGLVKSMIGTVQDLTQQVEKDQAQAYAHSLAMATLESTADGILVTRGIDRSAQFNKQFLRIWNMPVELPQGGDNLSAIEYACTQVVNPEDFLATVKKMYSEPEKTRFDEVKLKDGRVIERYSKPLWVQGKLSGRVLSFRDVTQERKAKEKIAASERKYRTIFDNLKLGILVYNLEEQAFSDCNPSLIELFGGTSKDQVLALPKEQLVQMSFLRKLEDLMGRPEAINQTILARGITGQSQIQRVDQEKRTVDLSLLPSMGLKGAEILCLYKDITDDKKTEQALKTISQQVASIQRDGFEFFATLVQSMAEVLEVPYVLLGELVEGQPAIMAKAVWDNGTLLRDYYYPLVGTPCLNIIDQKRTQYYPQDIQKHFPTDEDLKTWNVESYLGLPLFNEDHEVIGHIAVLDTKPLDNPVFAENILQLYSSRASAELARYISSRALQESEERYKALFEHAFQGVLIYDQNKRKVISCNQKLADLFGMSRTAFQQKFGDRIIPSFQAINPTDPQSEVDIMLQIAEHGTVQFEGIHHSQVNHAFITEISYVKMEAPNDHLIAGIFHDITEKRKAEERVNELLSSLKHQNLALEDKVRNRTKRLSTSNAQLRQSNKELEQFAYVASHDLQEPLRMVGNFVQLLELEYSGQLDQEGKAYIKYAVDGVKRMEVLIHDLLDYSRMRRKNPEISETSIFSLIQRKLWDLQPLMEEKGVICEVEELPQRIKCASQQIGIVFQNLLQNAIKFNQSQPPVIKVGSYEEEDHFIFWVKDNGIGIDQADLIQIFEIFKRLHRKEEYPGTGIGLAICERIVRNHGGKIWAESAPGEGSTFYFSILKQLEYSSQLPEVSLSDT